MPLKIVEGSRVRILETGDEAEVVTIWEDDGDCPYELDGYDFCFSPEELELIN